MSATTTSYFASILARTNDTPSPNDATVCVEMTQQQQPQKRSNKVCGIILRKADHFLSVFGRRAGVWSFPKGHVESGETDWQCAIREFVEETGMYVKVREQPRRIRLGKGIFYFFDEDTYELLGTVNPQDTEEVAEVRWMSVEELITCAANRYIKLFLESHYPRLQPSKSLALE
jgi:bis(5'-nucleosidyl)-tetraphosphatase